MSAPLEAAVSAVRRGGLVVYPTDTLWGLGARVDDAAAVARVFAAKERPRDQPLSVALCDPLLVESYAVTTPLARRLLALLPGPLTLLLERRPTVPANVTGGSDVVGVRVPDHPLALELLRRAGPLTATSANVHGGPEPRTIEDARRHLGDRVNYYLPSPTPLLGAPSTLVDARGSTPRILRPGVLSEAELRRRLGE